MHLSSQLEALGHGRSGPQRSIGDPHEIPGGTHAGERRLFRGVISWVDVHGHHQAVEVSEQGWSGLLDRYRVGRANGPMGDPQERATVTPKLRAMIVGEKSTRVSWMGVPAGLIRMVRRTEIGSLGLRMELRWPSRMGASSSMLRDQDGKRSGTRADNSPIGVGPACRSLILCLRVNRLRTGRIGRFCRGR